MHYQRGHCSELTTKDVPELMPNMIAMLKFVAECCNGPYEKNQLKVYSYRTDLHMSFLIRYIDNVDSCFYLLKWQSAEYLLSLLEGGNKQIIRHFGTNTSFDIFFNLIFVTLKRLYLYALVRNDPEKYKRLTHEAQKQARKKAKDVERSKESRYELQHQQTLQGINSDFYAAQDNPSNFEAKTTMPTQHLEGGIYNQSIITQELMDYFKVENYEDIIDVYIKDQDFSSHILFQIAIKAQRGSHDLY